jgi:hypothetical protein
LQGFGVSSAEILQFYILQGRFVAAGSSSTNTRAGCRLAGFVTQDSYRKKEGTTRAETRAPTLDSRVPYIDAFGDFLDKRHRNLDSRLASSGAVRTRLFCMRRLASLPFFGALGAYLSARGRGLLRTTLLASIFPVLALTAAFLLVFPIGFFIERITSSPVDFSIVATATLRDGIGWVLVPGVALLSGGFLRHLLFNRRSWSKETAIG